MTEMKLAIPEEFQATFDSQQAAYLLLPPYAGRATRILDFMLKMKS